MPTGKIAKFDPQQLAQRLQDLDGWRLAANREAIAKSFEFADFNRAWAFMQHVAALAGELDHPPEWSNIYNRVDITLTTHEAGGVSARDITMAQRIDRGAGAA